MEVTAWTAMYPPPESLFGSGQQPVQRLTGANENFFDPRTTIRKNRFFFFAKKEVELFLWIRNISTVNV